MSRIKKRKIRKYAYLLISSLFVGIVASGVIYGVKNFQLPSFFVQNSSTIIRADKTIRVDDIKIALQEKEIPFLNVSVSSSSGALVGSLSQGTTIYFATDKMLEWQIESLHEMLTRLTIESRVPSLIDLRYSRPIVKF